MKMNMMFDDGKDCIHYIMDNYTVKGFWTACLVLKSPVTNKYEGRIGLFPESFEADIWIRNISEFYSKENCPVKEWSTYKYFSYDERVNVA